MMSDAPAPPGFPRTLTPREFEWVAWILPEEVPAYREMRSRVQHSVVVGPGRRGEGELILGNEGDVPDLSAPLPPVFAYGSIETDRGTISVTLREFLDGQASLEIVSHASETLPESFTEQRRWTYSLWRPGNPCPQCLKAVREVPMRSDAGDTFALCVCSNDKRIWLFDGLTQIVHLIPVTNFYNELMLHKHIRDPKIALDSRRLFAEHVNYADEDLARAFLMYNKLKPRVHIEGGIAAEAAPKKSSWLKWLG